MHCRVVKGTSSRYFPRPEILSFQFLTSITCVEWSLSSSHMALKGLQKRECIESVLFLLKTKRSGGESFWNIKPMPFARADLRIFALVFFFLSLI